MDQFTKTDLTDNSILYFKEETPFVKFDEIWNIHPKEYDTVMIYGQERKMPRYSQSYDIPYTYSGKNHHEILLPEIFLPYKNFANNLGIGEFNQTLVNWYENGLHYIGAHSDDETLLKENSPIISFSLGEMRKFRIRRKKNNEILLDLDLKNGSIVIMAGSFQKELKHEITKVTGQKGKMLGPRINITMRMFKNV